MDYAKQKTITGQQQQQLEDFRESYTAELNRTKEDLQKQAEEDKAQLEKEIKEIKEKASADYSSIDHKLAELYEFRLESSKGQERIETKLGMLEQSMLSQFENLTRKLDNQNK